MRQNIEIQKITFLKELNAKDPNWKHKMELM